MDLIESKSRPTTTEAATASVATRAYIDFLALAAARLPQRPDLLRIKQAVCAVFTDITIDDLISDNENARLSEVRDIAYYLSYYATNSTHADISASFGGRAKTCSPKGLSNIDLSLRWNSEGPLATSIRAILIALEKRDFAAEDAPSVSSKRANTDKITIDAEHQKPRSYKVINHHNPAPRHMNAYFDVNIDPIGNMAAARPSKTEQPAAQAAAPQPKAQKSLPAKKDPLYEAQFAKAVGAFIAAQNELMPLRQFLHSSIMGTPNLQIAKPAPHNVGPQRQQARKSGPSPR